MLNVESCNLELLPPNAPQNRVWDANELPELLASFGGLGDFELWWRPVKKAQSD
jgi:hypothetical protein